MEMANQNIAVANVHGNTVSIFRNTSTSGSVSFAPINNYTVGDLPHGVAIGDLDGDGKPDLVVPRQGSDTISVFRNTSTIGTVSFAVHTDFPIGSGSIDAAICDLDGDGKPEIIATNSESDKISVLRNTIGGSNSAPAPPKNLTASAGNGQVTLRWNKNTESDFLRYRIYGGTSSTPTIKMDSTTGGITDTTKTIAGLANGTTYYFRITAVDSAGLESGYSNEVSAKTNALPAVPQSLTATAGNAQVTLRWNKNTEADFLCYRIYGGTSSNPTIKIDSTTGGISDTTKIIAGLANGTTYYFRITAVDSAGLESAYSNEVNARPNAPPAPPQNLTATTTDGQVILKWYRNVEYDFLRYRVYGGTSPNPTSKIDSTTGGITDTTKVIAGLTNGTDYYFRITAVNSAGLESGYSNEISATPLASPTLSSPSNGATNQLLTLSLSWTTSTRATKYHLQVSTSSSFDAGTLIVDDSTLMTTSRQVGPLSFGTTYHWRVSALNNSGASPYSPVFDFSTIPAQPATVNASVSFHFPQKSNPAECAATDYRLIGIPGNVNQDAGTILGGTPHTDWDIYRDNGNANNFFNKYDGGMQFKFTTGKAFWIISKGDISINRTVSAAPLNSSYQAEIPLHAGWNLITNPFGSSILWSKIQDENNISTWIHTYNNGTFATATLFDANVGYYFFNGTPNPSVLSVLKIPYQSIFAKVAEVPESKPDGWRVNIELNVDGIIDSTTQFGISQLAKQALDKYDVRKPRTVSIVPEIFFDRKEWDEEYPSFSTDIRPSVQEVEKWTFTVKSEPRKASNDYIQRNR